ncbi:MAG TPA: PHB depolymerase family esterase [Stellaceae bacterium]
MAALAVGAALALPAAPDTLAAAPVAVADFGTNPGQLRMFAYVPEPPPSAAPLVVVLHGCAQNARDYASESGWIKLADALGLVLVLPEQTQANNSNKCFNWFDRTKTQRGQGEALSIKEMVDKMRADRNIDPQRIFVTGLSAGGAMTSVMLAAYPDVFSGGGIVAGLPYGCAASVVDAFSCMSTGNSMMGQAFGHRFSGSELGDLVRGASKHTGPFPRVSIWHGSADTTVNPINATEEMEQWTDVHGIPPTPTVQDTVRGFPHQTFATAGGDSVVETFAITGMPHGTPVDPGPGPEQCGATDKYIIDAHICASFHIAKFWGLVPPRGASGPAR